MHTVQFYVRDLYPQVFISEGLGGFLELHMVALWDWELVKLSCKDFLPLRRTFRVASFYGNPHCGAEDCTLLSLTLLKGDLCAA